MSRKLEEAQGKLEDNESVRKKLQNRLEGLNRQMEEGQGDRERLVEQLETLRGQVRILSEVCFRSGKLMLLIRKSRDFVWTV